MKRASNTIRLVLSALALAVAAAPLSVQAFPHGGGAMGHVAHANPARNMARMQAAQVKTARPLAQTNLKKAVQTTPTNASKVGQMVNQGSVARVNQGAVAQVNPGAVSKANLGSISKANVDKTGAMLPATKGSKIADAAKARVPSDTAKVGSKISDTSKARIPSDAIKPKSPKDPTGKGPIKKPGKHPHPPKHRDPHKDPHKHPKHDKDRDGDGFDWQGMLSGMLQGGDDGDGECESGGECGGGECSGGVDDECVVSVGVESDDVPAPEVDTELEAAFAQSTYRPMEKPDLELVGVKLLDAGSSDELIGPRFRVAIRNISSVDVEQEFTVTVAAGNDKKPSNDLPRNAKRVEGVEAGQTINVDVRLPFGVMDMNEETGEPFSYLFVLADSQKEVDEVTRTNNAGIIPRAQIQRAAKPSAN